MNNRRSVTACFISFTPTAIYLAKKNIRKQGELMEYEKVRVASVFLMNYAATSPLVSQCPKTSPLGEIQHPEQEDQPHVGLRGDAGQRTT